MDPGGPSGRRLDFIISILRLDGTARVLPTVLTRGLSPLPDPIVSVGLTGMGLSNWGVIVSFLSGQGWESGSAEEG